MKQLRRVEDTWRARVCVCAHAKRQDDDTIDKSRDEMRALLYSSSIVPFLRFVHDQGMMMMDHDELAVLVQNPGALTPLDLWDTPHRSMAMCFVCKYLDLFGEDAKRNKELYNVGMEIIQTAGQCPRGQRQ